MVIVKDVMKIGMFCDVNSEHYHCHYGLYTVQQINTVNRP